MNCKISSCRLCGKEPKLFLGGPLIIRGAYCAQGGCPLNGVQMTRENWEKLNSGKEVGPVSTLLKEIQKLFTAIETTYIYCSGKIGTREYQLMLQYQARIQDFFEELRKEKNKDCKNQQLKAEIASGLLTVSIGVERLQHTILTGREYGSGAIEITNRQDFLEGVKTQLLSEKEDGSTLIHNAFDMAIYEMLENGEPGVDLADE